MVRRTRYLLAFAVGLAVACVTSNDVREELEEARACAEGDTCEIISLPCPIGCWALVNAADVVEMQALVDRYVRQHRAKVNRYECKCPGPPEAAICEEGLCVPGELEE